MTAPTLTMSKSALRSALLVCTIGTATLGHAQNPRDGAATLGRDLGLKSNDRPPAKPAPLPVIDAKDAPAATAIARTVLIGAVRVEGADGIAMSAFAPAIERFIGTEAGPAALKDLARAIADVAREQGYVFVSAYVPAQSVENGALVVNLDMGRVDSVRLNGATNVRALAILRKLEGRPVRRAALETQLLLAGDVPGTYVTKSRFVREGGRGVLIVDIASDAISADLEANNVGSHELGPARVEARADVAGVIAAGDQLTAQVVSTALQPQELAFGSMRYTATLGTRGLQVGVAGSVGRTQPDYDGADVVGKSTSVSLFANQPLVRRQSFSLWATTELSYSHSDQRFDGFEFQVDKLLVASLGVAGTGTVLDGRLWSGATLAQGIGTKGTTAPDDVFASRPDASGRFTKLTAWLDWTRSIDEQVSVRLAATGQLSDRPLLAAQEIGLGGSAFGRAYDFSEVSGDQGILGLLELRQKFGKLTKGVDWIQTYQFVDGGTVMNLHDGVGGGTLFSAGAGVRAQMGHIKLGVEAAFPIDAKRARSNDRSPRLNLSIGRGF